MISKQGFLEEAIQFRSPVTFNHSVVPLPRIPQRRFKTGLAAAGGKLR